MHRGRGKVKSILPDGERHIPSDIAGSLEAIGFMESWIGTDWLRASVSHPLRNLWRRRDILSSIELIILGKSIERLLFSQLPSRLTELANTIKGNDYGNQVGAAYELTTAAMLDVNGQRVRLMGAQQPVYDIEVEAANRTIHFSCKALLPASVEREFDLFVVHARNEIRACATRSPIGCVCALSDKGAGPEHLADRLPFKQMYDKWLNDERLEFKLGAWWFSFHHLVSEYSMLKLSTQHPSFTLLVGAELSGNEERRIADKIGEARRKFRTNQAISTPSRANAIALRLPPSISLRAAVAAADASWTSDDQEIAGVLLTRLQFLSDTNFEKSSPRFQWQWVPNPTARHPLTENALHCDWPVGEPMQGGDIIYHLTVGNFDQQIKRGFARSLGQLSYELVDPLNLIGKDEINIRQSPATESYIVLPDGDKLSLETPPTNSFVLL